MRSIAWDTGGGGGPPPPATWKSFAALGTAMSALEPGWATILSNLKVPYTTLMRALCPGSPFGAKM